MDEEEWKLNKGIKGEVISSDTKYVKMTYVIPNYFVFGAP